MVNNIPTQLLCTFTTKKLLPLIVDNIINDFEIINNKIFVLETIDHQFICSYNIELSKKYSFLPDTISVHRKKQSNTLYTINALNSLIRNVNNGVLDTNFKIDWENYRDCLLVTVDDQVKRVDTKLHNIINTNK